MEQNIYGKRLADIPKIIIHRTWDGKLINAIADYWRDLNWENNTLLWGKDTLVDKRQDHFISFFELAIDFEIATGFIIPSCNHKGYISWHRDHPLLPVGELRERVWLFSAVSNLIHNKSTFGIWVGKKHNDFATQLPGIQGKVAGIIRFHNLRHHDLVYKTLDSIVF